MRILARTAIVVTVALGALAGLNGNGAAVSAPARISFHWIQMIDSAHGYALSGENANAYHLLSTSDGGRQWRDVTPGKGTWHPLGPLSVFGQTRLFSRKLG